MSRTAPGVAAGALTLALLASASCTSSHTTTSPASSQPATGQPTGPTGTTASAGPRTYRMGQAVQFRNNDGQYTETVSDAHYTTQPGDQISTARHGGWLVATVDIAVTSGRIPFNPLYFLLVGPDGARWGPDSTAAGYDPALRSGDLNAGDRTHGYIAFDAPASAAGSGARIAVTDVQLDIVAYWSL